MYELPLADELFLVGHDQYSGKPQISDGALDTALAGGVLGELVLAGRLSNGEGTRAVVPDPPPPGEAVAGPALSPLRKHPQRHPLRAAGAYLPDPSPPS